MRKNMFDQKVNVDQKCPQGGIFLGYSRGLTKTQSQRKNSAGTVFDQPSRTGLGYVYKTID